MMKTNLAKSNSDEATSQSAASPPTASINAMPSFDLIARPYRWLEYLTLGRALERCRLHYLPHLLQQKQALFLGDGDGRFLAQLLANNPHIHADAIDNSAAMLRLLHRRCESSAPNISARLRTHHASALSFALEEKTYDLVVTHFFLDCLTQFELEDLVARVTPNLAAGAIWLVSDFRVPEGAMRLPAKLIIRSLYLAFRVLTGLRITHLPDHTIPLRQAGLILIARQYHLAGLLFTELWQTNTGPVDSRQP